jgi:rod shape-determining protein MreC
VATARPGWSRRAQYGLFFSFLAVIAGILVGLILLVMSMVAPKTFDALRGAALDVTGPVATALHEVTATAQGLVTGADDYWDAARQNGKLKRERKAMLQRMVEAKAIHQENLQLKAALQLRQRSRDTVATGRIVGSSFNSPRRFAILSAGASDGVRESMPVRSAGGLVGRIVDVGAFASRVLLVSDRTSIVPGPSRSGRWNSAAIRSGPATSSSRPGQAGSIRRSSPSRGS